MNNQTNFNDHELNLSDIKQRMGSAMEQLGWVVFRAMRFAIKNAIALLLILVVGVGLGTYLDSSSKIYENQIMLIPNFNSADYLYSQIELLDSKLKQGDSTFLKAAGFEKPRQIVSIKIEPVTDIFPMIQRDEANMELFKLLAENGDIKKVLEDPTTSMNYRFHKVTVVTKSKGSDTNLVNPLLNFLNNNPYYTKIKDQHLKNLESRVIENERTIAQINGVLDMFASYENSGKGSNMVYYNNQLNDVIKSKEELVEETGNLKIDRESANAIIKKSSVALNVKGKDAVAGKMKLILPILFIFLFVFVRFSIRFYKTYAQKAAIQ